MSDPFTSIETIWAIWAASLAGAAWLSVRGLQCIRWPRLQQIALDENGAAYTLSYVMVIPFYILLMCLVVETTLLILAKFGTNYAAYAGARSAVVHYSGKNKDIAEEWAQHAAVQAFVPFANGVVESGDASPPDQEIERYLRAYTDYTLNANPSGKPALARYLRSKYRYAKRHLDATIDLQPYKSPGKGGADEPWLKDLTVTVNYRFAFHIPIVGRLFGETDADGTFYTVTSTATLDSEAPKNDDELLGINYEPKPLEN